MAKVRPGMALREAQKEVQNIALDSNFAVPGDPGFPLNQVGLICLFICLFVCWWIGLGYRIVSDLSSMSSPCQRIERGFGNEELEGRRKLMR